jgi:succinate dehydrogenase / fumarate reductase, membrane anchor subunit
MQRSDTIASGRLGSGLWPWILQRATGAVLLVVVSVHLAFWHYRHPHSEAISASGVAGGSSAFWVFWGGLLGGLCLFHGLNGLRGILYDYGLGEKHGRWITATLCILGCLALAWVLYNLSLFAALKG